MKALIIFFFVVSCRTPLRVTLYGPNIKEITLPEMLHIIDSTNTAKIDSLNYIIRTLRDAAK